MSMYSPSPIPQNAEALPAYIRIELKKIQNMQGELNNLTVARNSAPARVQKNAVFLADGVNWNPAGTGFGYVYWGGSQWKALSSSSSSSSSSTIPSLDFIPNGHNFIKLAKAYANAAGRALIDFADKGNENETLQYVKDTNIRFAAVQAGADNTSKNTAADTAKVDGIAANLISPIAGLMPVEAGAMKAGAPTYTDTDFTIPVNQQILYSVPIELGPNADLIIDGDLVGVS